MPFHVEVRHSFRRAWAFNVDEQRLRHTVIDPWRAGGPLELGDREWDPRESTLKILEGPALEPSELAFGRGWQNAERSARDVTAGLISGAAREAAAVCVLAASPSAQRALHEALDQLGVRAIDWAVVRERILATESARPPERIELVAMLLAVDDSDPSAAWLFEAGLALGALGRRAIIAQIGERPLPSALDALGVTRVGIGDPASLQSLAQCLGDAGYPFEPA